MKKFWIFFYSLVKICAKEIQQENKYPSPPNYLYTHYPFSILRLKWHFYTKSLKWRNLTHTIPYLRNLTEVVANSLRPAAVATMSEKGLEAMFQPPTANSVFRLGYLIFNWLKRSYLQTSLVHAYFLFVIK